MLRPGTDAPLSYAAAEYCLYIFLFLRSEIFFNFFKGSLRTLVSVS